MFQNKTAETLLEFERMADFGFEKRDFRKVLHTPSVFWSGFTSVDIGSKRSPLNIHILYLRKASIRFP